MAANTLTGKNISFPIYNADGTPFHNIVLRKATVDSIVMSLGDKITGDVYYKDNNLQFTMQEHVKYNDVNYYLVNPPTVVREGMVSDNSELKGMTKYSFEFYHPMYMLANFPFTDIAVSSGEEKYLSQNKKFSWIGKPQDFFDKLNKNLQGTEWYVCKNDRFPQEKDDELSEVLSFDNVMVSEAIKTAYETWDIPYVISQIPTADALYAQGKRFVVEFGLPSNEIYESESARQFDEPFVFKFGQDVGLKNNSRTPRNNKIVTRIAGYGSEENIPYGYPQIVWTGIQSWDYTINNDANNPNSYPLYKGIVGGNYVKLIKHPFTRNHLMPSIYSETVNKKVNPYAASIDPSTGSLKSLYDPTIEIKDYYDAVATEEYPYANEINLQAPSYESHEFEDIKPELDSERALGIVSATPLNDSDLTPADSWDDTMDDDGKYLQSYFRITLPQLSFDLYACAAITQEMQINMRSGACIGCTFTVQVDWDDYKKNFYNDGGDFVPNGTQRDLNKYPKSNEGSISVIVQKDNSTFGTLKPNVYQQPKSGDTFVFIGISLPLSYITSAEKRLDEAMKSYMLENNVYYFDYPLKFDEHFLATHTYILEQIHPNTVIRFEYNNEKLQLFVKQLTIKYDNKPLPAYEITLTDNIEVVLNQIGQVADDVEKLSSLLSIMRQSYNRNAGAENADRWAEIAKKLSKTQDDTAQGFIRFMQGLQVGNLFTSGILGEGGVFRVDANGKTYIEADELYIRMKSYFDNVEIKDYKHTSGNRIVSEAGMRCTHVEWYNSANELLEQNDANLSSVAYFRCYYRRTDGTDTITNDFVASASGQQDLAFCDKTNVEKGLNHRRYWRAVIGRNGSLADEDEFGWIDLSANDCENGSDVPMAGDDIIQLGNRTDKERQGAIVEYVGGEHAPSYQIYQDINSFSLNNKNYIGLGYNSQTGRAYLNVFGDSYIGDPNGSTYINYHVVDGQPRLDIKATINALSTIGDKSLSQYVKDNQDKFDDSNIMSLIKGLQDQVDNQIETWYGNGAPTGGDDPLKDFSTDDKIKHVGDLYYNRNNNHSYRYMNDGTAESPVFVWKELQDTDVTKALGLAGEKKRIFISQPTTNDVYDVGDLWVNATYKDSGIEYSNEILISNSAKASGAVFSISHWSKASKYTDDSALTTFINGEYKVFIENIKSQVDKKAETWYQSSDPSTAWETKEEHLGDLWYNTTTGNTYYYDGTKWKQQNVPNEVFDKIDGKASIFTSKPSSYSVNDLWILESAYTLNGVAYQKGELVTATETSTTYNAAHWTKKVKYTDDAALDAFKANQYVTLLTSGQISHSIKETKDAADAAQSTADDANSAAGIAQSTADAAKSIADSAKTRLDGWADDSRISPTEKMALKNEKADVEQEYKQIKADAERYGVTMASFTSAYNAAIEAFNKYTAATPENITVGSDFGNIAAYYVARLSILEQIAAAAKKVADDAHLSANNAQRTASDAYSLAQTNKTGLEALGYLKQALGQTTEVSGGLVLSTLIALRDSNNKVWSGINGAYNQASKGGGTAAWYGGGMVDHEFDTTATNYAKSLFRFDGSGYLAGGNITWDDKGFVTIANVYSNVNGTNIPWSGATLQYISNLSTILPITIQSGVTYLDPKASFNNLSVQGKDVATQEWVGKNYVSVAFFERLFKAYNGSNEVSPNSTSAIDNIKAMFGFWTEQYISALGRSTGGSGGSETLSGLMDVTLTSPQSGQSLVYNGTQWVNQTIQAGTNMTSVWSALAVNTTEQINTSHLTTALSIYALKADVPTKTSQITNDSGFLTSYTEKYTGTVTQVKVGTTAYNPSSGVVSLPAYPTNTNQLTNGAGFITSSALNSYLPLSGGTLSGALGKSLNYVIKPNADFRTTTLEHTGCITITLPASIGNVMVSMWIDVYNYVSETSFSVHVGGYTYLNSTWTNNPFAMVYGAEHRVRLGHNGTNFVIYIGETDSQWKYPQVSVRDVIVGFRNADYNNWLNDWEISFSTSVQNVTATRTNYAYTTKNLSSLPASDVYAWAKAATKPSYTWNEIGNKPTTLSGYGITDGLYTTEVSVPQTDASWAKEMAASVRRGFVYNINGTEFSYLFGLRDSARLGAVLKMGYEDTYLRIIRKSSGIWRTDDWEKISAGYADDAGTLGGLSVHTGRNNEANKIVRTDGSGFIQAGWINTTSGNMGTNVPNRIFASDDAFVRYITPGNFFSNLSNSNNTLSVTIAGHNRTLTVNYANNSSYLNSLGDYTFANIATNIPVNALSYRLVTSGGTVLGDTQYNVIHVPYSYGDYGSYLMFGTNKGRVGVKFKAAGAVREIPTIDDGQMNMYGEFAIATNFSDTWTGDGIHYHPWFGYDHRWNNIGAYSTVISDYYGMTLRTEGPFSVCGAYGGKIYIDTDEYLGFKNVYGHIYIDSDGYCVFHNSSSGNSLTVGEKFHFYGAPIHAYHGIYSDTYSSALGQNTSSDIRRKDIKENFVLSINDIATAPMVRYKWKDQKALGLQVGSIAQYWERVLPEAVHDGEDGYKTMQYDVMALLSSIAIARKVKDHERRIDELEQNNEKLQTELKRLKTL